jgi:hypothetical protein
MNDTGLSIRLDGGPQYLPGEVLSGEYRLDLEGQGEVQALEFSVLWNTEGKGDEDLGVHHFEERSARDHGSIDPAQVQRFAVPLPNSPLSYDGVIVKVLWRVRLRVRLAGVEERLAEAPFRLGRVAAAREV